MSSMMESDISIDDNLIDVVRKYPALYDVSDVNYRNAAVKKKIWYEISQILDQPVDQCKSRWTAIRASYRKDKSKNKRKGNSKYSDKLDFLDNSLTTNLSKTKLNNDPENDYSIDTSLSPTLINNEGTNLKTRDSSEHPIEIFFRSMAATVAGFPPHLIIETRLQVCNIVSQMELRALQEAKQQDSDGYK